MENAPNIVYLNNKKTGATYAYEDCPYWDSGKKQARSKRMYLGKVDPATGKIIPAQRRKPRGQKKPRKTAGSKAAPAESNKAIGKVLAFLKLFMNETLAKRVASIVLFVAGADRARVAELVGLCDKSARKIESELNQEDFDSLFRTGSGGRKGKLVDFEQAIVDEIRENNYHSHQQIADMIEEKHGIKVSLPAVGRLLKKTKSGG
jgi:transposase